MMNMLRTFSLLTLFGTLILVIQGNSVNGGQYIGCYKDSVRRAMPYGAFRSGTLTTQSCISYCKRYKFLYAGMQVGSYCFCGNTASYAKYGKLASSECNVKCIGNHSEICGGGWKNSVYATGQGPYIGCYKDSIYRAMPNGVYQTIRQTTQTCIKYCKGFKFEYAGLQAGSYCFCGNTGSYDKYGKAAPYQCSIRCKGNSKEFCGGIYRNSVYATGI